MKQPDDRLFLEDILGAAASIEEYMSGVSYLAFISETMRQDAVVRQLTIIGEAASRVSSDIRKQCQLPWTDIIGMRHRMVHDYSGVDLDIVWDTAQNNIPRVIQAITALLAAT